MKKIATQSLFILAVVFILGGCDTDAATPTAVAETNATEEKTDTPTPSPTDTAVPTETPAPTNTTTPVPSDTPSPEPTVTPSATTTNTPTTEPTATVTASATIGATSPPTSPPATAVPVSAPPPAPAPAGPNLLQNPGFENGATGWSGYPKANPVIYEATGKPQFVHSGQKSTALVNYGETHQIVQTNIVPGQTYRAGVWVKLWSSTGIDRSISENPGGFAARICLSATHDIDFALDTIYCSGWVQPYDVWQFIAVDAVAEEDKVVVIFQTGFSGSGRNPNNEAIWDDATLGIAPAAATATPAPVVVARPAPIAFEATSLRESMNSVRWQIEQMGGVLDRMYNGEPGKCEEYQGYYDNIILSATYESVPNEWQNIYNDYIFAVENTLSTNSSLDSLCDSGGGAVSQLNYGVGRRGINASLDRLIPAIEAANSLIGG